MQWRVWLYFVVFALLPGLLYQYIQDWGRADLNSLRNTSPGLAYFLGIAPNALGGVSLTAGLITIGLGQFPKWPPGRLFGGAALLALSGLWMWEVLQFWLPNGTFDIHDLIWTLPGVTLSWMCAGLILPRNGRPRKL